MKKDQNNWEKEFRDDFSGLSEYELDIVVIWIKSNMVSKARVVEILEEMRQKHWVFECNGPRPDKTTKYENFCGDPECRSEDNKRVIARNSTLNEAITKITSEEV